MTQRQPQVGDYVLVHPEDVGGTTPRHFYASIVSVARSKVTVDSVSSGQAPIGLELTRRLAELRAVPRSEATGSKLGEWLRQAVWVSAGNSYRYGQVRGYTGSKLEIWTQQGVVSVTRRQLVGEVHPLISITLGFQDWPKRTWPKRRLQALNANLMTKLEGMGSINSGTPTVQTWLDELASFADISQLARAQVEWIDPTSGSSQLCSLQHALLFVVYQEMHGQPPPGLRERLGKTLTEEPSNFRAWVDRAQEGERDDPDHQSAIMAHAFLASLSDGEVSGDDRDNEQVQGGSAETLPRRSIQHSASNQSGSNVDASELELLEFLRDHRPHLLQTYMLRSAKQTGCTPTTSLEARPAACDINPAPTKRNKKAFYPTTDQERVHQVVTSDIHKGKSGEAYMEFLTTSSLPLDFHPGMLSRLYDLGFGSKGLSIGHFGRIGYLDRLRKAATGIVDMTDFTLPVPASPVLTSWAQLHAATRGFLQYCGEMCDPTTIRVAAALDNFALQLEGWNHWLPNEIPTLVLWINATMERYRNAAAHDSLSSASTRVEAAGWFSNSNPELQSLLITAISERSSRALTPARREDPRRRSQESKSRQVKPPVDRKVPPAVVDAIPRKDGKEVCLRFLSKRGCASPDQAVCKFPNLVHFHPSEIDPAVRQYITTKLGGVSEKYAQTD